MELSFNTRLTLTFIAGLVGLIWQGVILSFGGAPSDIMVTSFSGLILATIGLGVRSNGSNGGNNKNEERNKDKQE